MDITHMAITSRTVITGRIRTMGTIMGLHSIGTAGTDIITATIVTTIITDIKVTPDLEIRLSWLESNFEPAAF